MTTSSRGEGKKKTIFNVLNDKERMVEALEINLLSVILANPLVFTLHVLHNIYGVALSSSRVMG